ncbi:chemotaxis protein CheA [Marinilabiliaceae bacterium ANBcel2]|nr:chemotaxis protein CheA [Marinilabiliaceae bacterium ANBcel2]
MIDKFKAKFVEESKDNVQDLEEALLLLENDMKNRDLIERIFRAMHSLKGGGAMFGFNHLSDLTHHLEAVFDSVRNNQIEVTSDLITLTFSAIDQINFLLKKGDLTDTDELKEHNDFIEKINSFSKGSTLEEKVKNETDQIYEEKGKDSTEESSTYLITIIPEKDLLQNGTNPLYLLDDLHALGDAKTIAFTHKIPSTEILDPTASYCIWQVILSTTESLNEIKDVFIFVEDECDLNIEKVADINIVNKKEISDMVAESLSTNTLISKENFTTQVWKKEDKQEKQAKKKIAIKDNKISSIRVASHKIDELVTLVSELVTIQAQLSLYAEQKEDPAILTLTEGVQKLSRQLRENAFDISLIPLQTELMRFQRLVRDLSKEQEKEIEFVIEGGDLELDKNIIEHLTDPLLHIFRNSIDHGIESPKERISSGKPPKGTIIFKAYYSGANVVIEISDDGKGLDPEFIRKKAIEKEIIDQNSQLENKEVLNLLFVSGFSTKDEVSDVSGRGVGMDVVRRKIADIRGEVTIDSEKGNGTVTTIRLPMTLSIIDGLLVKVDKNQYVIPITAIEKIYALEKSQIKESFNSVVILDDEQIPFIDLRKTFNVKDVEQNDTVQMILIKSEERKSGLIVDSIIGEYQTVVKPLGKHIRKQEIISGASIMGDGSISLVIDTSRLLYRRKRKKAVS